MNALILSDADRGHLVVVQADFPAGGRGRESVRIRCVESYTDAAGYFTKDVNCMARTGAAANYHAAAGLDVDAAEFPATVTRMERPRCDSRIRNGNLAVTIHARKR